MLICSEYSENLAAVESYLFDSRNNDRSNFVCCTC